eukprot:sb/3464418/
MDLDETLLLVQSFRLKHHLTGVAFNEMLELVQLMAHCPQLSKLSSKAKFESELEKACSARRAILYLACSNKSCKDRAVIPFEKSGPSQKCVTCDSDLGDSGLKFYYTPIRDLLEDFLHVNASSMIKFMSEVRQQMFKETEMTDVHQSVRYRRILENSSATSTLPFLTLNLNIDGVQTTNSSPSSLYPVMLTVNELPPSTRFKSILTPLVFLKTSGCDFDQIILKPLVKDLESLSKVGMNWEPCGVKESLKVHVFSLPVDAVMRPALVPLKAHSGYYSCPQCMIKGVYCKHSRHVRFHGDMGSVRVYKNTEDSFYLLVSLNGFSRHTLIHDSLHGVYLGVVKHMVKKLRLFDDKIAEGRQRAEMVNALIDLVNKPSWVDRTLRHTNDMPFYKGHEWAIFLFYIIPTFVIILHKKNPKFMTEANTRHWMLLCIAIVNLNNDAITDNGIDHADQLLKEYVETIPSCTETNL